MYLSERERDVTYNQVWQPILGIRALHLPIQSAHTRSSEHTPRAVGSHLCCGSRGAVGDSCPYLAQGHISRGIEGRESAVYSPPPPTIPAGPRLDLANFGLRIRLSNHSATTSPKQCCTGGLNQSGATGKSVQ